MNGVTRKETRKLASDPMSFAILMEDGEIEHVIVTFVAVLCKRETDGGG